MTRWDPTGDGVDQKEFRENVLSMGVVAEPGEVDELFNSLDEDGGGSLDVGEIKAALKSLADQSAQADVELAQLKRTTGDLAKTAKAAQVPSRALLAHFCFHLSSHLTSHSYLITLLISPPSPCLPLSLPLLHQVELRKQQKADEVEAEQKKAVVEAELVAKLEEQKVAREKKAAAVALKKAAAEAEKAAFEAKVIARREQTSAAMKLKS